MDKITEIIPDDMPEWAWEAMDRGQLFNVMLDKIKNYEEPRSSFKNELQSLINRFSKENASNTPDFILAVYLENCLDAFNMACQQRETWYGRGPADG